MHPPNIQSFPATPVTGARFSIVIPTWNNLAFLQLCIESIRKHSVYAHEIILHINDGSDGTLAWVRAQPDISFTHSPENVGVCYAMNAAVALAHTEYIVYVNDDMYLCPGWDQPLYEEVLRMQDRNFFLSATMIEAFPQSNCSIKGDYGNRPEHFREQALLQEYAQLPMADWSGATWPPCLVHRDLWNWVGGYSVEFSPGMYSDPDFSMKLWVAGVRLFKGVAASRAYHFGSVSTRKVKKNNGYYRFIAKWGMTSGTFTNHYLRRGKKFTGFLAEPRLGIMVRLKNGWKRMLLAFQPVR